MANATIQEQVAEVLAPTVYTPETYISFYDQAYCLHENVTYSHRVDMPDNFNYCSVPLKGQDAFLFAGIALLVASFCMGKLSAVWMLIAGGIVGVLNYEVNLGRVSNAISLWLGIQPPDIFFYAFLPPLLTDAAMRLDWYIFKKIWVHIVLMAYIMVIINASILTPFILYGMDFSARGWDWVHGAVLAAIFAPTDAVSVTAMLKAGGGPEGMVVLMEGEALLNDASAVTLYAVFMGILEEHTGPDAVMPTVTSLIPSMLRDIVKLTGIGMGVGLAFAIATTYVLRLLRWRGAHAYVEAVTTLTLAYLAFYVAQSPAKGSGVIAVCVYGLYGSATARWGMLARDEASGVHLAVWDTLAFMANGLIFFWAGISAVNFLARAATSLGSTAWSYAAIPLIYIFMFSTRALTLVGFNPVFKLLGTVLTLPQIAFATVGALRGSLSLIMIADYTIHSDFYTGTPVDEANFDIILWTSAFVLLTLLFNAPMIGPVMRWTGLSKVTAEKVRLRKRAAEEVARFTRQALDELRHDDGGEFLQGANWDAVASYVDFSAVLNKFVPSTTKSKRGSQGGSAVAPPGGASTAAAGGGDSSDASKEASGGFSEGEGHDGPSGAAAAPAVTAEAAGLAREELDASEEIDGPVLEVPYLHVNQKQQWGARPPRPPPRAASSSQVGHPKDLEAGAGMQRSSLTPLRQRSFDGMDSQSGEPAEAAAAGPRHWLLPRVGTGLLGIRQPQAEAPSEPPAAADGAAAAAAAGPRRRALHRAFVSAPDVFAISGNLAASREGPPASTVPGGEDETSDIVMLYSKDDIQGDKDFEARYFESIPSASRALTTITSQRVAAPLPPLGSTRDLLGRTNTRPAGTPADAEQERPATQPPSPRLQRDATFAEALRDRRKEVGPEASGVREARRRAPERTASEAGDLGGASPADLRARVLTGLQRYFQQKRLEGLLSVTSLRILHYTCEKAAEELEAGEGGREDEPLGLWALLEREIRPTLLTRSLARVLAWLLRTFKGAPQPVQSAIRWPVSHISSLLRKQLGQAMLTACEVGVELYLGLSTAPQLQWVYSDDAPLWLLEEVEGELERVYGFIVEREAEAPHQYQAIQSYRAAMAVLQQQHSFVCSLYQLGTLDEGEQEELLHQLDRKTRHLEIVGPVWRPPHPHSVLLNLPFMAGVPQHIVSAILKGGSLKEYKPGEVVWSSAAAASGASPPRLEVVVSGVISRQWLPAEEAAAAAAQERREGIGGLVGLLQALGLGAPPGRELVVAQGNGLGRGPLLFRLPQDVLDEVRGLSQGGDAAAAALEAALLRVAAAHCVEYLEGDVTAAVHNYLALHHPLPKYTGAAAGGEEGREGREVARRVAKYSTQVLMDILSALPSARIVRLEPPQQHALSHHTVLLQGSLVATGTVGRQLGGIGEGEEVPAPAVLPLLSGQHRLFSFYAGPSPGLAGRETGGVYVAGPAGALLAVCSD